MREWWERKCEWENETKKNEMKEKPHKEMGATSKYDIGEVSANFSNSYFLRKYLYYVLLVAHVWSIFITCAIL